MNFKSIVALLPICLVSAVSLFVLLCPEPELYGNNSYSSAFEDRDGTLLRLTLASDERYRLKVPLDTIAPAAIDATVLYEDRHFFAHAGFNPGALLRAAWLTYAARQRVLGGSTITMQLARLRFDLNTRTVRGKLIQIARALQLERYFSKRQILEAYLNLAPYGGNIEGIGTASLIYFGKPASQLSLPEALALAVIPQNPLRRNPSTVEGYNAMLPARDRLLRQWQDRHGLSNEQQQQFALPLAVSTLSDLPFEAPHFVQAIAGDRVGDGVHRTTLDLRLQHLLESKISAHVARYRNKGLNNASAMLLDSASMQILASVGSADFLNDGIQGQVDGTRAKRSPGSTLKPFVYGMAIERGLIHPMSLLKDAPTRYAAYTPENFDRGFMGPIFARDALVYSRNVPAIGLLSQVGHKNFHRLLLDAHISNLRDADYYGLAAVLGGIELSMQEIVSLYAMLANGGLQRPIRTLFNAPTDPQAVRLLSAESSFLVLDMLRSNPRPNALHTTARTNAPAIAWKTGTSYAYRDAWSVGVFGPYVLAVWVGNFDGSSNPALVGRDAAAPLFFAITDTVIAATTRKYDTPEPTPDLNLRKVAVCAATGDLPGRHCPSTTLSWFVPGVSPIRVSNVHRAVHIDTTTGLRVCDPDANNTVSEIFEFWPSDVSRLFRQAGIAIRKPPAWSKECSIGRLATTGVPPRINSVSAAVIYQLQAISSQHKRVALTATTDADAEWLYWFIGDQFLGKAATDEPLLWQPIAGQHHILTVDDLGRSDSVEITVAAIP